MLPIVIVDEILNYLQEYELRDWIKPWMIDSLTLYANPNALKAKLLDLNNLTEAQYNQLSVNSAANEIIEKDFNNFKLYGYFGLFENAAFWNKNSVYLKSQSAVSIANLLCNTNPKAIRYLEKQNYLSNNVAFWAFTNPNLIRWIRLQPKQTCDDWICANPAAIDLIQELIMLNYHALSRNPHPWALEKLRQNPFLIIPQHFSVNPAIFVHTSIKNIRMESKMKDEKLYIVTHNQLSIGCQIVQVAHATANFVLENPVAAAKWSTISNIIVVLEVQNLEKLMLLYGDAKKKEIQISVFREMDLCDEITAIAFTPSKIGRKLLSELPLVGITIQNQQRLIEREKKLFQLSQKMIKCQQSPEQNVLQHGCSVRDHFFLLVDHLLGIITLRNPLKWKLPSWLEENRKYILTQLPSLYVMDRYLTLHDCGKPNVYELDTKGNSHFPNHAEASKIVFEELMEENTVSNEQITYLIAHDMDLHTINVKPDSEFFTSGLAMAQILAALAEITSNAAMFGGLDSTSFKIKFKRVDKRGNMFFLNLKKASNETSK